LVERSTDNRKVKGSTPFRPINYTGSYTSVTYYTSIRIISEVIE